MKKIPLVFLASLTAGCATQVEQETSLSPIFLKPKGVYEIAPRMAPVAKFGDKYFVVTRDIRYEIYLSGNAIIVPKGFITDLASIPRPMWSFGLSPIDAYLTAAIIHDYLYWDQRCTKDEADSVLGLAMLEEEVGAVKQFVVYRGVALFGESSYAANAMLKSNGGTRFLTGDFVEKLYDWPMPVSTDLEKVLSIAKEKKGLIYSNEYNPAITRFCKAATNEYAKR